SATGWIRSSAQRPRPAHPVRWIRGGPFPPTLQDVEPIRLLLVDDRTAIRHGLRMQLELEADVRVIGEAGDGTGAIALAEELDPDVVVMDVKMTPMDG